MDLIRSKEEIPSDARAKNLDVKWLRFARPEMSRRFIRQQVVSARFKKITNDNQVLL